MVFRIQVKVFAKAQSPWTLGLGIYMLDFGVGTLDSGVWILDFGFSTLRSGFRLWYSSLWTLCFELRTLDLGFWAFWISDSGTFALGILDF